MWQHFETFHVNQQPTYVSMYFPAQGLVLAVGKVIFGHPIWGVWLSTALMCAAICWMLQGWVAPQWALLGGLLAVVRLGTFSYWMNSYCGGSVAALGGALVLGAFPRVKQSQHLKNVLLMSLGFALLANSRPYEGLFFSIPVVAALLLWIFDKGGSAFRARFVGVLVPLALLFLLTVAFMGYYCWRTTGNPLRAPYSVNSATYRPVGLFPWDKVSGEISYRHKVMHDYYTGWVMDQYQFSRTHPLTLLILKALMTWNFFLGPALTIPFFAACFILPYGTSFRDFSPGTQFLLLVFGAVVIAIALLSCANPHYLAPVTCVFYGLLVVAVRRVRPWSPQGRLVGVALARCVPVVVLLCMVLPILIPRLQTLDTLPQLVTWCSPGPRHTLRQAIQDSLARTPGQHLLIVRYALGHPPGDEWVSNDADIDDSKVIWARDMGLQNQELVRFFSTSKVWMVEPDTFPAALVPYAENAVGTDRGVR